MEGSHDWLILGSSIELVCCILKRGQSWPSLTLYQDIANSMFFCICGTEDDTVVDEVRIHINLLDLLLNSIKGRQDVFSNELYPTVFGLGF